MVRVRCPGARSAGDSSGGRMSEQALDLRRSLQIVRRHKIIVGIAVAAGPRSRASRSPCSTRRCSRATRWSCCPPRQPGIIGTQVVIASSNPVLAGALHRLDPACVAADAAQPRPGQEPDPDHHLDHRPGQDRRPGRGHRERCRQQLRRLRQLRQQPGRASAGAGPAAGDERHGDAAARSPARYRSARRPAGRC